MKKLFALLLAVAMIASFAVVASADETESYTASLMYCDGDGNDMDFTGANSVTITGPGTYTLTYDCSNSADGCWGTYMLYVQIEGAYPDHRNDWIVSDVQISWDGNPLEVRQNVVYTTANKLGTDEIENYSIYVYNSSIDPTDYIIELANNMAAFSKYHGTAYDPGFVNYDAETETWEQSWRAYESISVTFTLSVAGEEEEDDTTDNTDDNTNEGSDDSSEDNTTNNNDTTVDNTDDKTDSSDNKNEDNNASNDKTEDKEDNKSEDKEDEKAEDKDDEKKPVADSSNAKTGDALAVVVAMMAVSALGIAVITKKH